MIENLAALLPEDLWPLVDEEKLTIVRRYCYLAAKPTLTEDEADQIELILQQAKYDGYLDFWIQEADHFLSHELGLRDGRTIYPFDNNRLKALLSRKLEDYYANSGSYPDTSEVQDFMEELASDFREGTEKLIQDLQAELQKQGYDPGIPDGIMGPRTAQALAKFQVAHSLQADGDITPETRTALGLK